MKISELTEEVLERLKTRRFDRIVEKHEGPFDWGSQIEYELCNFVELNGQWVLLPIDAEQAPNVTQIHCYASADDQTWTLFLKDTTYFKGDDEFWGAGYLAVCRKFPDENFYTAIVYHEWFLIEETLT